ncbi:unnamed protein product [Linum tenue]|uniref:Gem-associated protein 2 n=1 Tax=Linum tenue TaxID=586396 RepID=A0AAV0IHU3_9ROSI|nr:unnamed protein product [Linum tenue]
MTEAMVADSGGWAVPAVHSEEISESCSLLPALKDSPQPSPPIGAAPSPAAVEDDRSLLAGNNPSFHPLEKAGCVVSEVLVDDHAQETLVLGRCGGKMNERQQVNGGNVKRNGNQGAGDGKKKRPRRKRKDSVNEKLNQALEPQNRGVGGLYPVNGKYSRKELEEMRFLNIVEQRRIWSSIYNGLGAAVVKEYEELACSRNQKNLHQRNCDSSRHPRFGSQAAATAGAPSVLVKTPDFAEPSLPFSLPFFFAACLLPSWIEPPCYQFDGLSFVFWTGCGAARGSMFAFDEWVESSKLIIVSGEELSSENVGDELENVQEVDRENLSLSPSSSHDIAGGETPDTVAEEQYDEEDDSDDDYASIQKPAFRIEGEPNFDSGPPEDGWEYLRRVRWEAARIPKVKVAKLDQHKIKKEQSVYMPQIPDIPKCPDHLLPSKTWEDAFLADFSQLRLLLARDEESDDLISHKPQPVTIAHEKDDETQFHLLTENIILENVNHLCPENVDPNGPPDGSDLENTVDHASSSSHAITNEGNKLPAPSPTPKSTTTRVEDSSTSHPALSAILAMDSVVRVSTLKKRISSAESATTTSLSKNDCLWLFALCAAVDTPLLADTSAAIRGLLRKCASLRAVKSELDDEVVMLNILATICGRFFGQAEC